MFQTYNFWQFSVYVQHHVHWFRLYFLVFSNKYEKHVKSTVTTIREPILTAATINTTKMNKKRWKLYCVQTNFRFYTLCKSLKFTAKQSIDCFRFFVFSSNFAHAAKQSGERKFSFRNRSAERLLYVNRFFNRNCSERHSWYYENRLFVPFLARNGSQKNFVHKRNVNFDILTFGLGMVRNISAKCCFFCRMLSKHNNLVSNL